MTVRFSRRHNLNAPSPLAPRDQVPSVARNEILAVIVNLGYGYDFVRDLLCRLLHRVKEGPTFVDEAKRLLQGCKWYQVFEFCELAWREVADRDSFQEKLNAIFYEHRLPWKMEAGKIEPLFSPDFDFALKDAVESISASGLQTPATQIRHAIDCLSRRPKPDVIGAVSQSLSAVETTAREIVGDRTATLGEILKKYPDKLKIPKPLDSAAEKLWGFASEMGRHVKEGLVPSEGDAQLTVSWSLALISFLLKNAGRGLAKDEKELGRSIV